MAPARERNAALLRASRRIDRASRRKHLALTVLHELKSFFKDLKHAPKLGFAFLMRHPMALAGQNTVTLPIRGVGPLHMRYRDSDAAVIRQVFSRREYDLKKYPQERRLQAAYETALAAGQTPLIIDCGANIGIASIWFAKRYPKAQIVAIEPDPGNLNMCRPNVAPFANIRLVEGAIGAEAGAVELASPTGQGYAVRTERTESGSTRIYTIAELRALAGPNAKLLLVKVDIEGFEADLFSTSTEWLDDTAALIVEPHDWMLPGKHSSGPLQKAMFNRDFEMLVHRESLVFIR